MSEITAQSIFDTTARHLRAMRRPSKRYGRGSYRGFDGARCAVGVHLTDEECQLPTETRHLFVDPRIVDSASGTIDALGLGDVQSLLSQGLLPERLVPHVDLLASLQVVHDNGLIWSDGGGIAVTRARKALLEAAELHGLSTAVVVDLY